MFLPRRSMQASATTRKTTNTPAYPSDSKTSTSAIRSSFSRQACRSANSSSKKSARCPPEVTKGASAPNRASLPLNPSSDLLRSHGLAANHRPSGRCRICLQRCRCDDRPRPRAGAESGRNPHGVTAQIWAFPPSTKSSIPVTKLLSPHARNRAALAISSDVPIRPIGTGATRRVLNCSRSS